MCAEEFAIKAQCIQDPSHHEPRILSNALCTHTFFNSRSVLRNHDMPEDCANTGCCPEQLACLGCAVFKIKHRTIRAQCEHGTNRRNHRVGIDVPRISGGRARARLIRLHVVVSSSQCILLESDATEAHIRDVLGSCAAIPLQHQKHKPMNILTRANLLAISANISCPQSLRNLLIPH